MRALAAAERPRLIVSFGIAGALGPLRMRVGDIFLGEHCRTWESGAFGSRADLAVLPDNLRDAVSSAAEQCGARCRRGTVVTVLGGLQPVPAPPDGDAVVDMETCAVVQAAAEQGIPVLSLRAISDLPEAPVPFSMAGGEEFRVKPLVLLAAILRRPRILRSLFRLKGNAALASRNLAAVMTAVTGLPSLAALPRP